MCVLERSCSLGAEQPVEHRDGIPSDGTVGQRQDWLWRGDRTSTGAGHVMRTGSRSPCRVLKQGLEQHPQALKALSTGLHTQSWGWAGWDLLRSGRQGSFFRAPGSLSRFPSPCSGAQAFWRQLPDLAHVPEGQMGLVGSPRNLHAPQAAAAGAALCPGCCPGWLHSRDQRRSSAAGSLSLAATQGAQGACSCQLPSSPGLAVFWGRSWRLWVGGRGCL